MKGMQKSRKGRQPQNAALWFMQALKHLYNPPKGWPVAFSFGQRRTPGLFSLFDIVILGSR